MKTRRFLIIQNFRSPYIARMGSAHAPHKMGYKQFTKGEQINGHIQRDKSGKPLYVTNDDALMIPLNVVKEVVTKDVIVSNAEGTAETSSASTVINTLKKDAVRFKYTDAAIIGALLGFGAYKLGVKKTWIQPEKTNMFISIGLAAALGMYGVYRFTSKPKSEN